jgi:hypothetical protein
MRLPQDAEGASSFSKESIIPMADYEPPDPGTILKVVDAIYAASAAETKLRGFVSKLNPENIMQSGVQTTLQNLMQTSEQAHAAANALADALKDKLPPQSS